MKPALQRRPPWWPTPTVCHSHDPILIFAMRGIRIFDVSRGPCTVKPPNFTVEGKITVDIEGFPPGHMFGLRWWDDPGTIPTWITNGSSASWSTVVFTKNARIHWVTVTDAINDVHTVFFQVPAC